MDKSAVTDVGSHFVHQHETQGSQEIEARLKLVRARRHLLLLKNPTPSTEISVKIAEHDVEEADLEFRLVPKAQGCGEALVPQFPFSGQVLEVPSYQDPNSLQPGHHAGYELGQKWSPMTWELPPSGENIVGSAPADQDASRTTSDKLGNLIDWTNFDDTNIENDESWEFSSGTVMCNRLGPNEPADQWEVPNERFALPLYEDLLSQERACAQGRASTNCTQNLDSLQLTIGAGPGQLLPSSVFPRAVLPETTAFTSRPDPRGQASKNILPFINSGSSTCVSYGPPIRPTSRSPNRKLGGKEAAIPGTSWFSLSPSLKRGREHITRAEQIRSKRRRLEGGTCLLCRMNKIGVSLHHDLQRAINDDMVVLRRRPLYSL